MVDAVLLLGADRYIINACVRRNVPATVVFGTAVQDGHGLPALPSSFTSIFVEDHSSPERILGGLQRAGMLDEKFLAILTTDEFTLVTASLVGKYLGIRGIEPNVAVRFRDKALQKRVVRDAGLAVSGLQLIEDIRQLPPDLAVPSEGAVLKPVAGAATRNTAVVWTVADIEEFRNGLRRAGSPLRTFVLEDYIAGEEWAADGVVHGGEVAFFSLAKYAQTCLETLTEQAPLLSHRLDPKDDAALYSAAKPTVVGALRALGLQDGIFHMELFSEAHTGRIIFSECAARRGGGLTQEEVMDKFAVDLADETLLAALGRGTAVEPRVRQGTVGMTFLPRRPGVLVSCPSPKELMAQPGVTYARIEYAFGQTMPSSLTSTASRIGAVLMYGATTEEFFHKASDTQRWFDERLVVLPPHLSRAELKRWHQENWPNEGFADQLYVRR